MERSQQIQLSIAEECVLSQLSSSSLKLNRWRGWLIICILTLLSLVGHTTATLLGRFYYDNGGKSLWMSTIVQSAGFPVLFPILVYHLSFPSSSQEKSSWSIKTAAIYASLGLFMAGGNLMYSYGLLYLPVSTYSILCATQLAFNAIFTYVFNSQKFTPYIFNSIILITLASTLLGVRSEGGSASSSKYPLGFILTISASAAYSLITSMMQFSFQNVLKSQTFIAVIKMTVWTNIVASIASVSGLFIRGEWSELHDEFREFEKGGIVYVMTLVSSGICWMVFYVGSVGLIFRVSSLFSNVISALSIFLVPSFAVVLFHDKVDGVKIVSFLIAFLGFVNYIYQHYLDVLK